MTYSHITKEDRFKIQAGLELDMDLAEIAERIGKHKSAISREMARNQSVSGKYTAGLAHRAAVWRRKAGKRGTRKLIRDKRLRRAVLGQLRKKKSPEQIAGRRK